MPAVIDQVRDYIEEQVFAPALSHPTLPDEVRSTIRNSAMWLRQFSRVGDLLNYMDRFQGTPNSPVFNGLRTAGLNTFEDIRANLLERFGAWHNDRTRLDDFVIGHDYTSSQLVIFAEVYDNRSGGILPIGSDGSYKAVFIKATLNGGKYQNQWIEQGVSLKYYLKSISDVFKEEFKVNAAIIQNPQVPIYAFVRQATGEKFRLAGIFRNMGVHTEQDGSKWFELAVRVPEADAPMDAHELQKNHKLAVSRAQAGSSSDRQRRLANAQRIPSSVTVVTTAFVRNPDVVAEVLDRAAGVCEGCKSPAPFFRSSDGTPFLEVHHKVPLAAGGEDTVANAVALCPNCHRNEHYGNPLWPW